MMQRIFLIEGVRDIADVASTLREIKQKNVNRTLLCHLNVNGIRNNFECIKTLTEGKIDTFVVSETKLDSSFPSSQFSLDGFSDPLRRDRNKQGRGILIYFRNDIPLIKK